jgi:hypothetical protein
MGEEECAAFDIFFSSGTLQYLETPLEILKTAFASAQYAVVLAHNSFSKTKLFRLQTSRLFQNGAGADRNDNIPEGFTDRDLKYPHQTIDEAEVLGCATDHGFKLVARTEETSGVLPYRGIVYGRQLVFTRVKS